MHLAQLNIADMKAPIDSPLLADFVAEIEQVNRLAEASEGFVWRLVDDAGEGATALRFEEMPNLLINMSVWESVEALEAFVYRNTEHLAVMRERKKWFNKMEKAHTVLWWIEEGHVPTLVEARKRLDDLWRNGATARAFSFDMRFGSED